MASVVGGFSYFSFMDFLFFLTTDAHEIPSLAVSMLSLTQVLLHTKVLGLNGIGWGIGGWGDEYIKTNSFGNDQLVDVNDGSIVTVLETTELFMGSNGIGLIDLVLWAFELERETC